VNQNFSFQLTKTYKQINLHELRGYGNVQKPISLRVFIIFAPSLGFFQVHRLICNLQQNIAASSAVFYEISIANKYIE